MKITYSAPGKIILSGEHSVVYGKPAFVTAVNLRLTVTINEGKPQIKNKPSYASDFAEASSDKKASEGKEIHDAVMTVEEIVLKYLRKQNKVVKRTFRYSYESAIPEGRGMGSSAAFCVATVAALLHFYTGHEHEKQIVNSLAYQGEKYFHGMPSGVDVSASCFGGLIFYRKEFEFLKNISSLNFKIPKKIQDKLVLIDSGQPLESTSQMVQHVGKRYNENPKLMETVFNTIEKLTKRMVVSIVKEDMVLFQETVQENQKELENIGIVSMQTKQLLKDLEPYGVGKVTGAGGLSTGSGLILFFAKDKEGLKRLSRKNKLTLIPFEQDFEGVKFINDRF